jgi:hypothetical protein
VCAFDVPAQEALLISLAGEQSAEARRKSASALEASDMKLGPTLWKLEAGLGLEANDNIQLVPQPREGDLIFRPQAGAEMLLPVSDKNTLILAMAGGYSAYVEHPQFNRWFIRPGSELSFDLYAGDFWWNVHDRLSLLEDAYQDPTVVGVANYALLQNVAGISVVWDLNKLKLKLGYDHVNYDVLSGADQVAGQTPDGDSEVFSSSLGYTLRPGLFGGLEMGGSFINYSDSNPGQFFTEATQWNVGAFVQAEVTDYTAVRASVGYDQFLPEPTGGAASVENFEGLYFQASLANRFNRFLQIGLDAGQNLNFSLYGGVINLTYARLGLDWTFLRKIHFTTSFTFEHGTQIGVEQEHFDRYGPGMSLGRELAQNLSATLRYQYYDRVSDLAGRDYTVNIATVDLQYRF